MAAMKPRKCPFCGAPRTTRSPSGEHLLCMACQRIIIVPRKESRKEDGEDAASEAKANESGAG